MTSRKDEDLKTRRPVDLADFVSPWSDAFAEWHHTGNNAEILRLLRSGEQLSRDHGTLLAAIISGEWKRPKVRGRYNIDAQFWRDEEAKAHVEQEKNRIAREAKRQGLANPEPYRAALEIVAPLYELSADGLDKRIRKTKYKRKSPHPYKAFREAVKEILAKSR